MKSLFCNFKQTLNHHHYNDDADDNDDDNNDDDNDDDNNDDNDDDNDDDNNDDNDINNDNCELVTHFYSSSLPSFYFRFENKFANQRERGCGDGVCSKCE